MNFSYYYDLEKTHAVRHGVKKESLVQLQDGRLALSIDASIEESISGSIIRRQEKSKTFLFMPDDLNKEQHDIVVSRILIAEQGKWVLEIRNRQNESDVLTIGLLTDTIGEPILLEVEHKDDYRATTLANTLSRIPSQYNPPLIEQTRFAYSFDTTGLPQEITSKTATYDGIRGAMRLSDMQLSMATLGLSGAQFETVIQILPATLTPIAGTSNIFTVTLENIGTIEVMSDMMRFTGIQNGAEPVSMEWGEVLSKGKLESYYVHPEANFYVKGDGVSELTIGWYGKEMKATYNAKTQRPAGVIVESGKRARV